MLTPRAGAPPRAPRAPRRLAVPALVLLALALGPLAGCVEPVRGQAHPALAERTAPIRAVAVVPFRVSGTLATSRPGPGDGPTPSVVTALVTRHLSEVIGSRGATVIPAEDTARALGIENATTERLTPRSVAAALHERFGVDAVLMGEVWRFVEREGQAAGATRPASVGFEAVLYAAPGGQKLWNGVFDETQKPLSENVLITTRYPGGGTRWLTAEELLRWGATEVARSLPLSP